MELMKRFSHCLQRQLSLCITSKSKKHGGGKPERLRSVTGNEARETD